LYMSSLWASAMLSRRLFIANGGRGPTRLGTCNPSWMSIPKRCPSATGFARARLMYSKTSCSSGVGLPESYLTRAVTVTARTESKDAISAMATKARQMAVLCFKSTILVQLPLVQYTARAQSSRISNYLSEIHIRPSSRTERSPPRLLEK
jgi:hypothetical protein